MVAAARLPAGQPVCALLPSRLPIPAAHPSGPPKLTRNSVHRKEAAQTSQSNLLIFQRYRHSGLLREGRGEKR